MEELVLHIGTNKTGSTAIQATLAATRRGPDWTFIAPGLANASNVVRLAFHPGGATPRWRQATGITTPDEARSRLDAACAAVSTRRGILSGEGMFRMGAEPTRALLDRLGRHAGRIGAVVYLRPPLAFLVSNFQQRMKMGYTPLSDLVRPTNIDYRQPCEAWHAALGPDNLLMRPYDRDRLIGGSVVPDLAHCLDLGPLTERSPGRNAALSGEAMRLLVQFRRRNRRREDSDGRIIRHLQELDGERFDLAPALLDPARPLADAVRRWAEERLNWDMAEPKREPARRAIATERDFDDILPETHDWLARRTGMRASVLRHDLDATAAAVAALAAREPEPEPRRAAWLRGALRRVRGRSPAGGA